MSERAHQQSACNDRRVEMTDFIKGVAFGVGIFSGVIVIFLAGMYAGFQVAKK